MVRSLAPELPHAMGIAKTKNQEYIVGLKKKNYRLCLKKERKKERKFFILSLSDVSLFWWGAGGCLVACGVPRARDQTGAALVTYTRPDP